MGIKKPGVGPPGPSGAATDVTMPSFSFGPNDGLAELIVQAWTIKDFRDQLLERDNTQRPTNGAVKSATDAVNAAGFNLKRAVVISEKEHDSD